MREALRFEVGPELEPVRGQTVEVVGSVGAGAGVEPDTTDAVDDLTEFVGFDELVGGLLGCRDLLAQRPQAQRIRPGALGALRIEVHVECVDVVDGLSLLRDVLGSDLVRALERHVFEHVREAGLTGFLVHRAGIDVGEEAEHRTVVPLEHDEAQTVAQLELGHLVPELARVPVGGRTGRGGGGDGEPYEPHGHQRCEVRLAGGRQARAGVRHRDDSFACFDPVAATREAARTGAGMGRADQRGLALATRRPS